MGEEMPSDKMKKLGSHLENEGRVKNKMSIGSAIFRL
jgi:hypothetical protein